MLIPKKDRKEIYKYLFKEGVLCAPKDAALAEHPELTGVKNLFVMKAMQSFESKALVTARYAWRYHYWFLTDAGIEYLREYLNIPAAVAPATLIKAANRPPMERGPGAGRGDRDGGRREGGGGGSWSDDRAAYRPSGREGGGFGRGGGAGGDKGTAPAGYTPQFS